MNWPTPEQKFEMLWQFLAPEIRRKFFEMYKEGIVYAVSHKVDKRVKRNTKVDPEIGME